MAAHTINVDGMPTGVTLGATTLDLLQAGASDPLRGPCLLQVYWASEDQAASNLLTVELGVAQGDSVSADHIELHPGSAYRASVYVPAGQTVGVVGSSAFDVVFQVVR